MGRWRPSGAACSAWTARAPPLSPSHCAVGPACRRSFPPLSLSLHRGARTSASSPFFSTEPGTLQWAFIPFFKRRLMEAINRGSIKPLDAGRTPACAPPRRPCSPYKTPGRAPLAAPSHHRSTVSLPHLGFPLLERPRAEERPGSLVGTRRDRRHLSHLCFDLVCHEFELTDVFFSLQSAPTVVKPLRAFPETAITSNETAVPPRCFPYL